MACTHTAALSVLARFGSGGGTDKQLGLQNLKAGTTVWRADPWWHAAAASNVRSYLVIIGGVFRKNSSNVFCVEHDQMVCALADPLQNISAPADLPLPI